MLTLTKRFSVGWLVALSYGRKYQRRVRGHYNQLTKN